MTSSPQASLAAIASACDTVAATYEKLADHFATIDPELSKVAEQCATDLRTLEAVLLERACNAPIRR